jgi:D-alanyl-D-alanine carboxypeptidase
MLEASRSSSLLLPLALAATLQAQSPPVERAALVRRLDSLAHSFLVDAPAVGATIGVVRGEDTLYLAGVGERDRERHRPARASTVYHIGSITKQFTAAAVMRLVERGTLHLSDSLSTLLPQYPQWRAVTVRQLLNHTSGIHSYTTTAEWRRRWKEDVAPSRLVALVAKDTFDFAPGTAWRYNNTGYVLLGMVLEHVTQTAWAAYLGKELFTPLGLHTVRYCPTRPADAESPMGYEVQAGRIASVVPVSMTHTYAAGALCMSVPDYLRWQAALTSGRVISAESYRQMSTADTLTNGASTNYGFGLIPARLGSHVVVHHGGDVHGFSAEELWLPGDSLRVVVFTNTLGSNPKFLADNLASAVLGLPLRVKTTSSAPITGRERAKYEGTYDIVMPSGRVLPLRVFNDANGLAARGEAPGQGTIRLIYIGDDTFGAEFDAATRLSFVLEKGRAVKARFTQGGQTREGLRRP